MVKVSQHDIISLNGTTKFFNHTQWVGHGQVVEQFIRPSGSANHGRVARSTNGEGLNKTLSLNGTSEFFNHTQWVGNEQVVESLMS